MFINYTHYTHTQIGLATPIPRLEGEMDEMDTKSVPRFEPCKVPDEGNSATRSQEICAPPKKVYCELRCIYL